MKINGGYFKDTGIKSFASRLLFLYLRWLAGDEVTAVYPGISGPIGTADRSSAFVVTDVGVTHIRGELMSLNDKAMEIAKVYDSQGFSNSPF